MALHGFETHPSAIRFKSSDHLFSDKFIVTIPIPSTSSIETFEQAKEFKSLSADSKNESSLNLINLMNHSDICTTKIAQYNNLVNYLIDVPASLCFIWPDQSGLSWFRKWNESRKIEDYHKYLNLMRLCVDSSVLRASLIRKTNETDARFPIIKNLSWSIMVG